MVFLLLFFIYPANFHLLIVEFRSFTFALNTSFFTPLVRDSHPNVIGMAEWDGGTPNTQHGSDEINSSLSTTYTHSPRKEDSGLHGACSLEYSEPAGAVGGGLCSNKGMGVTPVSCGMMGD